jgi:8-oxo-dGTP pyrophosphatase MutT (NUDIX family)
LVLKLAAVSARRYLLNMLTDAELSQLLEVCRGKYSTIVVDAFLFDSSRNSILLQRRSPDRRLFPNFWDAFGGHLEGAETLREALAREVKEESGMDLMQIMQLVHQFEWRENSNVIDLQFLCSADGTFVPEKAKVTDVRWVRASELSSLEPYLTSDMREGLQKAFRALASF